MKGWIRRVSLYVHVYICESGVFGMPPYGVRRVQSACEGQGHILCLSLSLSSVTHWPSVPQCFSDFLHWPCKTHAVKEKKKKKKNSHLESVTTLELVVAARGLRGIQTCRKRQKYNTVARSCSA